MTGIMKKTKQDFGVLGKNDPSSGEAVFENSDDAFFESHVDP